MNNHHEIDLAYQGLPEDRRMANDPRSTAENNVPAAESVPTEKIP